MGLFLDLQSDSIDQPACFYSSTMQFLLLLLCSTLELRDDATSRSSFIMQDCFSYPGFLFVCSSEVENGSVSKECVGIMMRTAMNL